MGVLDVFKKKVGVDPGSDHLRIAYKNQVIFDEKARISVNAEEHKVTGFGNKTIYQEPNKVLYPVHTVIADFHAFEHLLRKSVKSTIINQGWYSVYQYFFAIPTSSTEVEKRAYRDSAEHAGATEVHMIYQSVSAAIGMGILFEKKNFILVDVGASKVDISIFNDMIPRAEKSIRIGTRTLQKALRNYLFRSHQLRISDEQAQTLLVDLPRLSENHQIESRSITKEELMAALDPFFAVIEDRVLEAVEEASNQPNIKQIISNGFQFTGGGAHIDWISKRIALNGKMNISFSSSPLLDTIHGLMKVMEKPEQFKTYLMV